jgi:mersacidin/lichenicidin family type 2 lantibiotic
MIDVIRAWKDEKYFRSLTSEQREALPAHPSGLIELSDDDIRQVFGGSGSTNTDCSKPAIGCSNVSACNPSCSTTVCTTYACCP